MNSIALAIPAVIGVGLAIYAWRQRQRSSGAILIAWFMIGTVCASVGYGVELAIPTLDGKLPWVGLRYIGNTGLITPLILLSALWYSGQNHWLRGWRLALIFVGPALNLLGFFTNPWHNLHYRQLGLDLSVSPPMLVKSDGPLYVAMIAVWVLYLVIAVSLLIQMLARTTTLHRRQVLLILVGLLSPVLATVVYLAGWRPLGGLNFAPFAYTVTGLAFGANIFGLRLLNTKPIAFQLLFQKVAIGVLVVDEQDQVVEINPVACQDLGVTSAVIGQSLSMAGARWPALVNQLAEGGAPDGFLPHWDGRRQFRCELYPVLHGQQASGTMILLRDATQRLEAERQQIEQQRLLAVLDERERLARELHDGLGQVMGYVSTQTQAASAYLSQGQTDLAQASLTRLTEVALDAYADVRSFILEMKSRGEVATGPGFAPALEHYAESFTHMYGLPVHLSLPATLTLGQLAPEVELHLLRIIQEALNNIRKHAAATQAQVTVLVDVDTLQVLIADDGRGFAAEREAEPGHMGLSIMRERATEAGGSCEIRSRPGQGTQVIVRVPLAAKQATPTALSQLRLLLADDHPLFRDGLRNLLTARGLSVVGEAENGRQALDLARQLGPDVVLMDLHMPEMDGLEATRLIKAELPGTQVVILTMSEDEASLVEALRAGASGYLLKNLQAGDFFQMLESLTHGETPISSALAGRILAAVSQRPDATATPAPEIALTSRQREILELAASGLMNKEIGLRLNLSESAVKYHISQIFERLHVANRNEAIARAEKLGFLDPNGR